MYDAVQVFNYDICSCELKHALRRDYKLEDDIARKNTMEKGWGSISLFDFDKEIYTEQSWYEFTIKIKYRVNNVEYNNMVTFEGDSSEISNLFVEFEKDNPDHVIRVSKYYIKTAEDREKAIIRRNFINRFFIFIEMFLLGSGIISFTLHFFNIISPKSVEISIIPLLLLLIVGVLHLMLLALVSL